MPHTVRLAGGQQQRSLTMGDFQVQAFSNAVAQGGGSSAWLLWSIGAFSGVHGLTSHGAGRPVEIQYLSAGVACDSYEEPLYGVLSSELYTGVARRALLLAALSLVYDTLLAHPGMALQVAAQMVAHEVGNLGVGEGYCADSCFLKNWVPFTALEAEHLAFGSRVLPADVLPAFRQAVLLASGGQEVLPALALQPLLLDVGAGVQEPLPADWRQAEP